MSKPNSLELSDTVILGIPPEERPPQSDIYRRVRANRSDTVEKPLVRRVLGIEVPATSVLKPLIP